MQGKFLLYILSSNKVQEEIQTLSQGATLKQLTIRQLKEISIPIPPLDFQKKLLNELESYQKVIDGCRQVLDNYKPTIEFDPSWEEVELIEISNKITDGSHNPPKEKIGGSFKMLSSKNIQNNKIIFKDFREIDEESFEKEDKRTKISEGDVLLTIVGTIGRTAVIENNIDRFTLQRSVAVIKLQLDKCLPKFLSYLLQTDYYQKILNENAQGVAQKGIYLKQLQSLKMFIPSLEVQLKIVNKIDEEIKIINSNQQLIQNFSKKIEDKINKIWNN